jgi:hypothetical protein
MPAAARYNASLLSLGNFPMTLFGLAQERGGTGVGVEANQSSAQPDTRDALTRPYSRKTVAASNGSAASIRLTAAQALDGTAGQAGSIDRAMRSIRRCARPKVSPCR